MASRGRAAAAAWSLLGLAALLLAHTAALAQANEHATAGVAQVAAVAEEAEETVVSKVQSWLAQFGLVTNPTEEGSLPVAPTHGEEPKPPPEAKLAAKLVTAVGAALKEYYASEVQVSKAMSCADAVGNETKALLMLVAEEVDAICKEDSEFETFCSFYADLRNITAVALLSKLKINPISIALTRTAVEGPCAVKGEEVGLLHQHVHKMKKVARVHWGRLGGAERLSDALMVGEPADDISECKECIKQGLKVYAEMLLKKIHFVCSTTKCPRIKAACEFAREHPYLTQVALLLKLKPWESVIQACALLGHCRPPAEGPEDSQPGKALYFLPNARPFHLKGMDSYIHAASVPAHPPGNFPEEGRPAGTGLWRFLSTALFGGQAAGGGLDNGAPVGRASMGHHDRLWHWTKCHRHHRKHEEEEGEKDRWEGSHGRSAERVEGRLGAMERGRVARSVDGDGPGPLRPRGEERGHVAQRRGQLAGVRMHMRKGGVWGIEMKRLNSELVGHSRWPKKFHHREGVLGKTGGHGHRRVPEGEGEGEEQRTRSGLLERRLQGMMGEEGGEGEGEGGRHHHGKAQAHMGQKFRGFDDRVKRKDSQSEDEGGMGPFQRQFGYYGAHHKRTAGEAVAESKPEAEANPGVIALPRRVLQEGGRHHRGRQEEGGQEAEPEAEGEVAVEGEGEGEGEVYTHHHMPEVFEGEEERGGARHRRHHGRFQKIHKAFHNLRKHRHSDSDSDAGAGSREEDVTGRGWVGDSEHEHEHDHDHDHEGSRPGYKHQHHGRHGKKHWRSWIHSRVHGWEGAAQMADSWPQAQGPTTWLEADLAKADPLSELALLGEDDSSQGEDETEVVDGAGAAEEAEPGEEAEAGPEGPRVFEGEPGEEEEGELEQMEEGGEEFAGEPVEDETLETNVEADEEMGGAPEEEMVEEASESFLAQVTDAAEKAVAAVVD